MNLIWGTATEQCINIHNEGRRAVEDGSRQKLADGGVAAGGQYDPGRAENVDAGAQIGPSTEAGPPLPKLGEKFTEDQMAERFGVPPGGGIRTSKTSRDIILVSRVDVPTGYDDDDSGEYVYYSGYVEKDDGQMADWRNKMLSESRQNGRRVLYFVKDLGKISFHGCVECVGWEPKDNPSRGRVVVFKMRRVGGAAAQAGSHAEYTTAVRIEEDEDGWYVATATGLPGCISQGETRAQARENLEEAISLYMEYLVESGEAFPPGLTPASSVAAISVRGKSVSAKIGTV